MPELKKRGKNMTGLFIVIHALVCIVLIVIVLGQSGRGGGLTESFAAAESVFGAKTNEFMVKATAIGGTIFLITSLSLAYLSSRAERSLMSDMNEEVIEIELPVPGESAGDLPALPAEVTSPEKKPIEDYNRPVQAETTREMTR